MTRAIMNTRRFQFTLSLVVLAALAAGCGTPSQMVNLWKDPSFPKAPISNALVICLRKDMNQRHIWEDAFVRDLVGMGMNATPSYSLFPTAVPDTQQVIDAVRRNGYDGVIVAHRLPTIEKQTYVPGYVSTVPVGGYYGYYGAYGMYYAQTYQPGYTVTDRIIRFQIDVWSAEDGGRLVWMGTTETLNPRSYDEVRQAVTGMIVPELKSQKVIGKQK